MVWHSKTKSHYLIGGSKDSMNPIACDEVKRYHNGKWSFFNKLPDRVAGAQSIVIQDRIYVFGKLCKVECKNLKFIFRR